MKSKILKVNCSFCNKEIECPEDMINAEKHACFECFQKLDEELPLEDPTKIHVDIPMDKMDEIMPEALVSLLMEEEFPKLWKEEKLEVKEMSKRTLAELMFATGAEMMIKKVIKMDKESNLKA